MNPFGDSGWFRHVRVWRMRTGISITVSPADRRRLQDVLQDRNAAQKHAWRAEIVLLVKSLPIATPFSRPIATPLGVADLASCRRA